MYIYIEIIKDIVANFATFNGRDGYVRLSNIITKYMFIALLATDELKPQSVQGPISANKIALFVHGRFLQLMPE